MIDAPQNRWDRALLRAAKLVLRARPAPIPDWGARPRRVLFLRHDKIGDMVMSTGVLRAIAESHPTIAVDVLASPSNAQVLHGAPFVDEVIPFRGKGPRDALRCAWALRSRRYDAVVDGLALDEGVVPTTAALLEGCGAPRRIGVGGGRYGTAAYTHVVEPPPHLAPGVQASHVEYLARLAAPFGVAPDAVPHPTLWLSAAETGWAEQVWQDAARRQGGRPGDARRARLLVNVSAGHAFRRWDDAKFAAAIRHVRAGPAGAAVLVVGEPAERAALAAIARDAGADAPATEGVRAAFALVAAATGVLTPDTSIAHAASAFRKPCVTLMLRGSEAFIPYRTPGHVVFSPTTVMADVPVEAVAHALDDLLAHDVGRAWAADAREGKMLVGAPASGGATG